MQEARAGCHHTEIGTQKGLLNIKCSSHHLNRQNTAMLCNQNQHPGGIRCHHLDISTVHQERSLYTLSCWVTQCVQKASLTPSGDLGLSLPTCDWGWQMRSPGSFGRWGWRCWDSSGESCTDRYPCVSTAIVLCINCNLHAWNFWIKNKFPHYPQMHECKLRALSHITVFSKDSDLLPLKYRHFTPYIQPKQPKFKIKNQK